MASDASISMFWLLLEGCSWMSPVGVKIPRTLVTPGISVITEKIYPNRFMHVPELGRMGARVFLEGPSAITHGVKKLSGAPVMASDLRASAALVLAGY